MLLSIVIPVFNEGSVLSGHIGKIIETIRGSVDCDLELILVDDGSKDDTYLEALKICSHYEFVRYVPLSRNFGKEAAILAGLEASVGDAVVVMDSDLQHPPSLVSKMLLDWREGYKVVHGCKASRGKEKMAYGLLSKSFYFLFGKLTGLNIAGHSDYKLLDRAVVDVYCNLTERGRFFRAMIPYLGFNSSSIFFEVGVRAGGASTWSAGKLFRYSVDGIANFTSLPLHAISLASIFFFILSIFLSAITLIQYIMGQAVEGFTTVIILILVIGSLLMFGLGQIGLYIEKIFDEVKNRPSYIVDEARLINSKEQSS